ncbi:MAG: hypothetical protein HY695_24085 [Deltaproteobacteria bacterium]|nr:hypothetical protein [Deltaproteobacteria bacterium]
MRLFRAKLEAKGYLHFYSSEYLKVTRVSDILHNWALMFAVNDIRPTPRVEADHVGDLRGVRFYCTPAAPLIAERRIYKRNPVPEDTGAGKMGLMEIEYYLPGSTFEFYLLSRDDSEPPELIHFGKKRTPCALLPAGSSAGWKVVEIPFRAHDSVPVRPTHLVNPIDYEDISAVTYARKVPMKPSPLYYLAATFSNVLVADRVKVAVPNMEEAPQWN